MEYYTFSSDEVQAWLKASVTVSKIKVREWNSDDSVFNSALNIRSDISPVLSLTYTDDMNIA